MAAGEPRSFAQPAGAPASVLTRMTLRQAGDALRARRASSLELTEACLRRIDTSQRGLNAFITVTHEHEHARARARARAMDAELRAGKSRGPLHGVPIAIKDNIDTAGIRTTSASAVFADRVPAEDADVVRRLLAAGAVIVGKTNLDEHAAGPTGRRRTTARRRTRGAPIAVPAIGLQIAGPHWQEGRVLALARAYEQATPWHTRRPLLLQV